MKLVYVVGPTATGKSKLTLNVAQKNNVPIVNCDSVQFFKGVDIGSAKPTLEERQVVPHYLFDIVEVGGEFTAGEYRRTVEELLVGFESKGINSALVVGGSGFYLRALTHGMYDMPEISKETKARVLNHIKDVGSEAAYEELENRDPEYAKKINANDAYRIGRALEVLESCEKKMSEIVDSFVPQPVVNDFHIVGLKRKRDLQRHIIQSRAESMLHNGLLDEAGELLEQAGEDWSPLKSVGYKEAVDVLKGRLKKEDLLKAITTSTFQLAKKQMTWFKKVEGMEWFDADESLNEAKDFLNTLLNSKSV